MSNGAEDEEKGLIWKLPAVKSKQLGKLGPAFGIGAGCGFGFGIGLMGGMGFGPGIPGLQLGFGVGAGCGVGLGFGYGIGRGIAYDETRRYSNVAKFSNGTGILPSQYSFSSHESGSSIFAVWIANTPHLGSRNLVRESESG